ncbi:MAG: MarR family transcriptional regulator [Bdellovibrionales bacterium]|nr:MarR family transcriptional regulator [Bdellovibrionales bacterium]
MRELRGKDIEAPPHGRTDVRILQSIRRIIRAVELHSRKLSLEHQITAPQLVSLIEVVENGPMKASELAKRVFLSSSTVVGILDRLEEKQLVSRKRDEVDRRVVHVTATDIGRDLVKIAPSPLQDRFFTALQRLPDLEQVAIALSLERVVELMEAQDLQAAPILESGPID